MALGKDVIVFILIATSLSSVTAAVVSSSNYYEFYPSILQLRVRLPALSIAPNATSLNGFAIFTVDSPGSYRGLALTQFEPSYQVFGQGGVLIPAGGEFVFSPPRVSLSPGTVVTYNISLTGFGTGVNQIYNMIQGGSKLTDFSFNFTIGIFLSTFIDTYAMIRALYNCNSQIGGGDCFQYAVILNSTPTPGTGGGGGL